jgi:DivIVA domain-containing protein
MTSGTATAWHDRPVSLLWVLVGIAVLGGVAVVAAGRGQGLTTAEPDRPDVPVPEDRPLVREDVDRLRFSVGLRGYRMDEVDDVLDRLAGDLAERDAYIENLEGQLAHEQPGPKHAAPTESVRILGPSETPPTVVPGADDDEPTPPEQSLSRTMIVPVHELDEGEDQPTGGAPDGG